MSGEHLHMQTRRVVTGLDASGRSTILSDDNTPTRIALAAFTVNDIWRVDALPTHVDEMDTLGAELELTPPAAGLSFRVAAFPPDAELDPAAYDASIASLYGEEANAHDDGVMGMHITDTFDLDVILSARSTVFSRRARSCCRRGTA